MGAVGRYARASAEYEAAVMSGDPDRRHAALAALAELDAAGEATAQAQARRLAAPDFETLLADPTIQ